MDFSPCNYNYIHTSNKHAISRKRIVIQQSSEWSTMFHWFLLLVTQYFLWLYVELEVIDIFECEDTRFFRWTTHSTMTHSIEKSAHYELDMMLASCARTRAQSICRSIIYASYKRVSVTIVNSPNTNSTPSYCSLHYLHYVYVCVCVRYSLRICKSVYYNTHVQYVSSACNYGTDLRLLSCNRRTCYWIGPVCRTSIRMWNSK